MRFAVAGYVYWIVVTGLTIVIAVCGALSLVRRQKIIQRIADQRLFIQLAPETSLEREVIRQVLQVLAVVCLLVAFARPQFGTHSKLVKRRGVDVVVALDSSKSMLAKDVSPTRKGNRLKRAKLEVSGLIDRLQGDRIGLVSFSGAAFVQCPLTSDYSAAKLFLRAMEAGTIPVGGTSFTEALRVSREMFENSRGGSRSKLLVLISDGEDHEGSYEEEVEKLRGLGVVIHTVGVGTQIGELIPDAEGKYLRNRGKTVVTRLKEGTLSAIAEATGGVYVHSAAGDLGFEVVCTMLSAMKKSDYESRVELVYEEKFPLFVLIGLLLIMAATLIPSRRDLRIHKERR